MEKIFEKKIFPGNMLAVEIVSVFLIIGAFFSSNILMLFSAALLSLFILTNNNDSLCIALFFFVLPFSQIFNAGGSSFLIFLKLAIIIRYFHRTHTIKKKIFVNIGVFILYSIFGMMINGTASDGYIRVINLVLWFATIYIMSTFSCRDTFFYAGTHFLFGIILSCIVALFADYIPGLNSMLSSATINSSISRFSGLWNDPNTFSVFMGVGLAIIFLYYSKRLVNLVTFYILAGVLSILALLSLSKMCLFIVILIWIGMLLSNKRISIVQKILIIFGFVGLGFCVNAFIPDIVSTYLWRFSLDSANSYSLDSLTTHRSEMWDLYIVDLNTHPVSWIVGNGIGCALPNGRAAHQSVLQVIYNSGIIGVIILIKTILAVCEPMKNIFQTYVLKDLKIVFISKFPLLIICIGIMFLDYYFIEYIYFLVYLAIATMYGIIYK